MFYHEPSSDELVGRSVVLEFGPKNEIYISKFGSQFIVSDTSFSNSKFPYFFDAFVRKIRLAARIYTYYVRII